MICREVDRNGGSAPLPRYEGRGPGSIEAWSAEADEVPVQPGIVRPRRVPARGQGFADDHRIELARAGGIGGDTVSAEPVYLGVYAHGTRELAAGVDVVEVSRLNRQARRRRGKSDTAEVGGLR